jgi:ribonuclease G
MQQEILIHSAYHETRVVVLEDGAVQELHIERHSQRGIVGNVYWGKVIRVIPGMQSAFIDVGLNKAAFLHVADIWHPKPALDASTKSIASHPPIEKQLFAGQSLMVQVLKDTLGNKGARLTTQISLAGRYVVVLPQDTHIGLSQKITDPAQREALRQRLDEAMLSNFNFGIIARTQAQDATVAQLGADLQYLQDIWMFAQHTCKTKAAPQLLYEDVSLVQRALRDLCTEYTRAIRVDGAACYQSLRSFAAQTMPAVVDVMHLHTGEHGLFDLAGVETQINAALQRRVELPSGAYLVIDQTESMCTIDVNTGKFVGGKDFQETILLTNLEATQAIARQLRLRNLGGIVLIDFIDMPKTEQREQVQQALQKNLSKDTVRTQLYGFTQLGLMELTRKRVRESLAHVLMQACNCCNQTAQVKTAQTVGYEILREIELQARQFACKGFEVQADSSVLAWASQPGQGASLLASLEISLGRTITFTQNTLTPSDSSESTQAAFRVSTR